MLHDVAQRIPDSSFPDNSERRLNRLGVRNKDGEWIAHMFVNRLGRVFIGHDIYKPWPATKLERFAGRNRTRGLFIHVEHNQPRRQPRGAGYAWLAPTPGFTTAQYNTSALLYIWASYRAGRWLIPAFHGVMDKGLSRDSHDDPQNFELAEWDAAIARHASGLENRR